MIYKGSAADHLRGLATMTRRKLEDNHRCLYLNSPAMVSEMRSCLAAVGVDVEEVVEQGALILSSDQSHLLDGRFDVEMLSGLAEAVSQALSDGYRGLWATGDMAWEFGNEKNFSRLREYEHALESFIATGAGLSGICQFNAETLPADVIEWGLYSHRAVYVNESLSKVNPYYAPVEVLNHRNRTISTTEIEALLARSLEPDGIAAAAAPLL
jgi:hypothetical protein